MVHSLAVQWDIRNLLSQMSDEPQLFFVFKAANWGGSWGGKVISRVAFATPCHPVDPPLYVTGTALVHEKFL